MSSVEVPGGALDRVMGTGKRKKMMMKTLMKLKLKLTMMMM